MSIQNSAVEVHNPSLFSEILGDGRLQVDVEPKPASKTVSTDISIQVSPRGKSRCSTSQPGVNAVEWLSRKARRAVVVSDTLNSHALAAVALCTTTIL